jgi:hypothetical protein
MFDGELVFIKKTLPEEIDHQKSPRKMTLFLSAEKGHPFFKTR